MSDSAPANAIESPPEATPESTAETAALAANELTGLRVLVVDDVADNRDLLVRRLKRLGITACVQAADGAEALAAMKAAQFDLLLLDIMMPVMNGYEVLEALNRDGRTHDVPVIVTSALNEIDNVARAIELGAEDFLFKPFNPILLRARVRASLEKKRMRDRTREQLAQRQAELAEAHTLQIALVPPDFAEDGIAIESVLRPAREIGGDMVDHFAVGADLHAMLVGDVSDKGAGAALVMARTHALFRGLASRPDAEALFRDPARAASLVNEAISFGNTQCMFATLFLATLEPETRRLTWLRAGHVPPFLRSGDGTLRRLDQLGGLPLGMMAGASYTAHETMLAPGDTMLMVTDGFTEGAAPDGSMFGEHAIAEFLQDADGPPHLSGLLARLRAHEAGAPATDDVAALLLRLERTA
jgi:phosphoserine phosphatase RsbU/P